MIARTFGAIAQGMVERKNSPVHRNSYDVDDDRAKVFRKIGDGSKQQGFAHIGAMRETLKALIKQQRAERYKAPDRLQRTDYYVYDAILSLLDFKTGALFPAYNEIAKQAAVCRQVAIDSVNRLKAHGFINWVRRSIRNDDEDGPARKQTSNAYFFDFRKRMAKRVWQTFIKALTRNLKRLGASRPAAPPLRPATTAPALQAALDRLEGAVDQVPRPSLENGLYPQVGD